MEEKQVIFNSISDKSSLNIAHPDSGETMADISGYGLSVKFNLDLIKSKEDMDAVCVAMSEIFKELLIKQILDDR